MDKDFSVGVLRYQMPLSCACKPIGQWLKAVQQPLLQVCLPGGRACCRHALPARLSCMPNCISLLLPTAGRALHAAAVGGRVQDAGAAR